ncbi:MAG: ABC transporter substrate-binding protein [Nocardioidaceae bacterium]
MTPHKPLLARLAAPAVATIAVAALLAGCSGTSAKSSAGDEPVSGGTLNVARANPFEGFDLDKETLNASFQISQAVLEPLIRPNQDGTGLEPGLAASWKYSHGNTVLTIELNPDATFSDGKAVTADDVAFSVKTWQAGPNYGATFAGITSTKVVDKHTIELHLAAPDTALPAFLSWANAGVVPKDFGGRTAKEFWQSPVGAGAFTVKSWSTNGKVVLERSDHYYRPDEPHVDEIVSTYASDPNAITLQMRSGQIDLADELLPVTASTLPEDELLKEPEHLTPVLLMNTKDSALADVSVRRAIGYAIDYQAIADSALKGYGVVPTGPLPTNSENWAPPSKAYFSHNVEEAENLLASAKTPPASLELIYPNDASSSLMAQVIQQDLSGIGIDVKLQQADSATAFGAEQSGDYQLGLFSYNAISPDVSDPAWYVAATTTMFTGMPVGAAVKHLTAYAATADTAKKKAEITAIQDLWTDKAPFIALAHHSALTGVRTGIHDVNPTPWGNYYYGSIWKAK